MSEDIANVVVGVLSGFGRLSMSIQEVDDTSLRASLLPKIDDDLARFKVWAGNSGAHRTGRASLEHRLRDASHIRQQVLRLLSDLKESLEDAIDIMTGKATPWEEAEDGEEPLDDLETETEMDQIALDIAELVDCLLRLSVSIQNPAPHDRFMSSNFTDTSAFEKFDIQHVQSKFQDVDECLAQRLGKAMSRRRQYFKYRQAHHDKLSQGLDRHGDTNQTEPSTLASSIPLQMKQEVSIDISGDDTQSDGRASATSFATSVSGPKTLKVPPIPEEALKGPFMCPFCYLIISVQDTRAWKKHVFGDLRPYNCLALHCTAPDREFSRRNEWMQHMLEDHLRVYRCPYGCPDHFSSAAESRDHLLRAHTGAIPESKVDSILKLSSQPIAQNAHTECPLCPEKLKSLKQYRRHVGNHQQDLALFVLPKTEEGDEDNEESHSLSGLESDSISFSEQDEDRVTATADYQQTVAGAEDAKLTGGQLISEDTHPQAAAELSKPRRISGRTVDLDQLFAAVQERGGFATTTERRLWVDVCASCGVGNEEESALKLMYETYLLRHESDWIEETGKHRNKVQNLEEAGDVEDYDFSERSLSRFSLRSSDRKALDKKDSRDTPRDQFPQLWHLPTTFERTFLDENGSQVMQHQPSTPRPWQTPENFRGLSVSPTQSLSSASQDKTSETITAPFMSSAGEMGISRLPSDDSQVDNSPKRLTHLKEGRGDHTLSSRVNVSDSVPFKPGPATSSKSQVETSQSLSKEASVETKEADHEHTKAKVLFDFTGETPNELTVKSGDIVDVLHQGDRGWSLAKNETEMGPAWIPTTYVEEQNSPTQEQVSEDADLAEESLEVLENSLSAKDDKNGTKSQFAEQERKFVAYGTPEEYRENHPEVFAAEFDKTVPFLPSDLGLTRADDSEALSQQTLRQLSESKGSGSRIQPNVDDAKDTDSRADNESTNAGIWKSALERFSEDVFKRRGRVFLPTQEPHPGSSVETPNLSSPAYWKPDYRARVQEAQSYQRSVDGGPAVPLTAASCKVSMRYERHRSSDSGRNASDYRRSATTRTTRSSTIEDEDITIKVTGSAALKIGGAEIECQDGDDEIKIHQASRSGRSGSIVAEPSRSDRDESPPSRRERSPSPVRSRASSADGRDQDGKHQHVPGGRPPFY